MHRKAEDDYHIDASPASCVNLALYTLVQDADLIISGPNVGHNAGRYGCFSSASKWHAHMTCISPASQSGCAVQSFIIYCY